MNWQEMYQKKRISLEEAAKVINSNDRVFFPSGASMPVALIQAICKRRDELSNVRLMESLVFVRWIASGGNSRNISIIVLF